MCFRFGADPRAGFLGDDVPGDARERSDGNDVQRPKTERPDKRLDDSGERSARRDH